MVEAVDEVEECAVEAVEEVLIVEVAARMEVVDEVVVEVMEVVTTHSPMRDTPLAIPHRVLVGMALELVGMVVEPVGMVPVVVAAVMLSHRIKEVTEADMVRKEGTAKVVAVTVVVILKVVTGKPQELLEVMVQSHNVVEVVLAVVVLPEVVRDTSRTKLHTHVRHRVMTLAGTLFFCYVSLKPKEKGELQQLCMTIIEAGLLQNRT